MKPVQITITALLVALSGGGIYAYNSLLDRYEQLELKVEAPINNPVKYTGAGEEELKEQLRESNAQGAVVCKQGIVSNMPPETVYCSDGKTAGFVLRPEVPLGEASLYEKDGEIYISEQIAK